MTQQPDNDENDAPSELEWTGERLLPGLKGQIAAEHLHRYALACTLAHQKDVLDIACGEGYGASLLARRARSVVGVDIDEKCISHAGVKYGSARLRFIVGGCVSIPMEDASVDLVVSFETIEHISEQERFFNEIRRVLRPGGMLIISTPERENYNEPKTTKNPFHVRELSREEFKLLVRRSFANSWFMAQKFCSASAMFPEDHTERNEWGFFSGDFRDIQFSDTLPTPTYFLALCGDSPLPAPPSGLFEFKEIESTIGAESNACVQVYADDGTGFSEARSVTKYLPFGILQTIRLEDLGGICEGRLTRVRIDPSNRPSLITVTRLQIISEAADRRVIFNGSEADLRGIKFVSCQSAYISGEGLVVVSHSDDPQMHLPALPPLPEGGGALEITLKVETGEEPITRGLRIFAEVVESARTTNKWQSVRNSLSGMLATPLRRGREFAWRLRRRFLNAGENGAQADEEEGKAPEVPEKKRAKFKQRFRKKREDELANFLKSAKRLDLRPDGQPKVSVIVVLFNQAEFTLPCLEALASQNEAVCEIIIVDNESTDRTGELLSRVDGATILRSEENIGFLKAVNLGAKHARGEHVLLLNNDAVIRPGSLSAAIQTLESARDIGAVGGRLILPDGSLQEAGSLVWNDGSCLGYGRGLKADASKAMYRRDVDFCSGAFLLVRREAFDRLGGFDESFAPAYYEETDLCMRLWESGLRVVYEPMAIVDHFEFASANKPEDAIAMQIRNRTRFLEKHARQLASHQSPALANVLSARQRDSGRRRILVIDDLVPLPERGAGFPRAREIVNALCDEGYFVTLWPIRAQRENLELAYNVLRREIEIINGARAGKLKQFLREREGYYDLIFVSRPHNMADVSRLFRKRPGLFAGARIIYDAEAVFAAREIAKARVLGAPLENAVAKKLMEVETSYARPADAIIVVSQVEAQHFLSAGYSAVNVVGHSLAVKPTPSRYGQREGFLFVGRLMEPNSPNVDSILWFASEVLPRIRNKLGPDVNLFIAGLIGPAVADQLNRPGITVLGTVDDLFQVYNKCRVFVAPTRFSSGIPLKVLEAAAHGLPVVVTNLLAEQLQWTNGECLLASGTADELALDCIRLYTDESLWSNLRGNALARVESECDPAEFRRKLMRSVNLGGGIRSQG